MKKGIFITLYGVNNMGKTTHAKRIVARLKRLGKKVVYFKYPIYDIPPSGPFINRVLRSGNAQKISEEELQLWFVLNRYQFQPHLENLLKKGTIVVAEDYTGTGIAWGTAKGANMEELVTMNKFLVQPDIHILLDGKRKERAREKGHLHESSTRLLDKTQSILRKLARRFTWKVVQVADDPDVTAARIWHLVQDVV